jgi:hypothetical protein
MYAYSEDRGKTWRNNKGEQLKMPIDLNSPGITVAQISEFHGLMNQQAQTVDSLGRIHAVMWHCTQESLKAAGRSPGRNVFGPPAARRYHHYWRDANGEWRHAELPGVAKGRPKAFVDGRDNLFIVFNGTFPGFGKGYEWAKGPMVIMGATSATQWKDWQTLHVEEGPFVNEMVIDPYRWRNLGVLSVLAQDSPPKPPPLKPTPLRVLDFRIAVKSGRNAE